MKVTSIIFYLFGHRSSKPPRYSHNRLLIHTASVTPRDRIHGLPIHARYRCRQICQPPQDTTVLRMFKAWKATSRSFRTTWGMVGPPQSGGYLFLHSYCPLCQDIPGATCSFKPMLGHFLLFFTMSQHGVANRLCLKIGYPQIRGIACHCPIKPPCNWATHYCKSTIPAKLSDSIRSLYTHISHMLRPFFAL